ncbi:hypothetical protein Y032_0267g753 [Ancylostoma ceylanicum]|uniref:Sphingomyelin synthase-like domain-containing protein n=1 Tax=Ancylostoma ceylanicum TaxID=53326 RepID=A0A016S9Z3_9BILA|nr:hypothetical protein Y032_0267g753 [Ancylostoma ceylanicum]
MATLGAILLEEYIGSIIFVIRTGNKHRSCVETEFRRDLEDGSLHDARIQKVTNIRQPTSEFSSSPLGYENNTMRCRAQANLTFGLFLSRVAEQAIRAGFQDKNGMLCGDMLFSGHTLGMITSALCIAYYLPKRWRMLQWVVHFLAAVGMACMIISRTHYTIDIVIAYWLSNFIFRVYHAFCEVDIFMERRKSVLYGLWMFWVVEWLEDDIVPGKIENKFEFPFDGLLRLLLRDEAVKHHKQISIVRRSSRSCRDSAAATLRNRTRNPSIFSRRTGNVALLTWSSLVTRS